MGSRIVRVQAVPVLGYRLGSKKHVARQGEQRREGRAQWGRSVIDT